MTMKNMLFIWLFCIVSMNIHAQVVTNLDQPFGTSSDGKYRWRISKVEIHENCTLVQFEVLVLRAIRRLNIYADNAYLTYGNEQGRLELQGEYSNGNINYLSYYSTRGWDKVGARERRYYTLCFSGGGDKSSIPSGAKNISLYGIGVEADKKKNTWKCTDVRINNPRRDYIEDIVGEHTAKSKINACQDGICGIYEQIGGTTNYKLACIKENGAYLLVYLSSSLNYTWWQAGDIKAYLRQSASGVFKADWIMGNKSLNNDCYIWFDGITMIVNHPTGSDPGERRYLKMYPPNTSPNIQESDVRETMPQQQEQQPQRRQVPQLRKTNK